MSRISLDKTLERAQIKRYRSLFSEYEKVKQDKTKKVKDFFKERGLQKTTFHLYYNRYRESGKDLSALLPQKRGPKNNHYRYFKKEIHEQVIQFRKQGADRYQIKELIRAKYPELERIPSASTIYSICRRHGLGKLRKQHQEEKRRIIKTECGELGHLDAHHLPLNIIKGEKQKLYLSGIVDGYSRVAWLGLSTDITAESMAERMAEALVMLKNEFNITFQSILTDNGPEFSSRSKRKKHPVEFLMRFFDIKHRYTRPYRPQTNGKIERLWRTLKEEFLEEEYDSIEELHQAILHFNIYYNYKRPHQAIGAKTPAQMTLKK